MTKAIWVAVILFLTWAAADIGIRIVASLLGVRNSDISFVEGAILAVPVAVIWIYKGGWPFAGSSE